MLFPAFLNAMFQLADMWCPTIGTTDYTRMLYELLQDCQVGPTCATFAKCA